MANDTWATPPEVFRKLDNEENLYASVGTDGCDYVDSETYDIIPCVNFYTQEAHNVRIAALNGDENMELVEKHEIVGYPTILADVNGEMKTMEDEPTEEPPPAKLPPPLAPLPPCLLNGFTVTELASALPPNAITLFSPTMDSKCEVAFA